MIKHRKERAALAALAIAVLTGTQAFAASEQPTRSIESSAAGVFPPDSSIKLGIPPGSLRAKDYSNYTAAQLFNYSWHSPSESEKIEIRSFIAKRHPETEHGLAARAYLEHVERGDNAADDVDRLANQCLTINPANLSCRYILGAYGLTAKRDPNYIYRIKQSRAIIDISPSFQEYRAFRHLYFNYRMAKDTSGAEGVLEELRTKYPGSYQMHVIEAEKAIAEKRYKSAEEYLEKAVASGVMDFEVHKLLADTRFELAKQDLAKNKQALKGIMEYVNYISEKASERTDLISRALMYQGSRLSTDLQDPNKGVHFYRVAFDAYPTIEGPVALFDAVSGKYGSDSSVYREAVKLLTEANAIFPNRPEVIRRLAWVAVSEGKADEAETLLKDGMANAPTTAGRVDLALYTANVIYEDLSLDFAKAIEVYESMRRELPSGHRMYGQVLSAIYKNHLASGKYIEALARLDDYEAFLKKNNTPNENWFLDRRRQLERFIGEEQIQDRRVGIAGRALINAQGLVATSPDGRLVAVGTEPIQIWDNEKKQRLFDLGRGSRVKFSPDGQLVATYSHFSHNLEFKTNEIVVYSAADGHVVARDVLAFAPRSLAWSPTGTQLVYVGDAMGPTIYDVAAKRRIRKAVMPGNRLMNAVVWLPNDLIVTGQAAEESLRVWNAKTLRMENELPGVNWPTALAVTQDGSYLVATDNMRNVTVWNTRNWSRRAVNGRVWTRDIAVHPTAARIALAEGLDSDAAKLSIIDLDPLRVVTVKPIDEEGNTNGVAFDRNGDALLMASGKDLRRVEGSGLEKVSLWTEKPVQFTGSIGFSVVGILATRDEAGIDFWDVYSGEKKFHWPVDGSMWARVGAQRDVLAVFESPARKGGAARVGFLNANTFDTWSKPLPLDVSANADIFEAVPLVVVDIKDNNGWTDWRKHDAALHFIDFKDDQGRLAPQLRKTFRIPVVTESPKYEELSGMSISGLSVSPDGKQVAVATSWKDGVGLGQTLSKQARVFSIETGKLVHSIADYGTVSDVNFDASDPNVLEIATKEGTFRHDLAKQSRLGMSRVRSTETLLPIAEPRLNVLWNSTFVEVRDHTDRTLKYMEFPNNLDQVIVFPKQLRIAMVLNSNEIRVLDLKSLATLVTIAPHGEQEASSDKPGGTGDSKGEENAR